MANNYADIDSIFDEESKPVYEVRTSDVDKNLFKPKAANQPNKEYSAIIRLLPYFEFDEDGRPLKQSILTKMVASIPNVNNTNLVICDNPETVGDRNNQITSTFWDLWHKADASLKETLKKCSLNTEKNYAVCQILKNDSEPETVGKIMVFEFGKSIHKLVDDAKADEDAGGDCFSLRSGTPIIRLKIGTKSLGSKEVNDMNNVECVYLKQYDFVMDANGNKVMTDGSDPDSLRAWKNWYLDFVKTLKDSWDRYKYKEPTAEQYIKIADNYKTFYNMAGVVSGTVSAPVQTAKPVAQMPNGNDIPDGVPVKDINGDADLDDILKNL